MSSLIVAGTGSQNLDPVWEDRKMVPIFERLTVRGSDVLFTLIWRAVH